MLQFLVWYLVVLGEDQIYLRVPLMYNQSYKTTNYEGNGFLLSAASEPIIFYLCVPYLLEEVWFGVSHFLLSRFSIITLEVPCKTRISLACSCTHLLIQPQLRSSLNIICRAVSSMCRDITYSYTFQVSITSASSSSSLN